MTRARYYDLHHAARATDVSRGMCCGEAEFRRCMALLRAASDTERGTLRRLYWQRADKLAAK